MTTAPLPVHGIDDYAILRRRFDCYAEITDDLREPMLIMEAKQHAALRRLNEKNLLHDWLYPEDA